MPDANFISTPATFLVKDPEEIEAGRQSGNRPDNILTTSRYIFRDQLLALNID